MKNILEFNSKEKENFKGLACPRVFSAPCHLRDKCVYSALFHAKDFLTTQSVSKRNTNIFFQEHCLLPKHFQLPTKFRGNRPNERSITYWMGIKGQLETFQIILSKRIGYLLIYFLGISLSGPSLTNCKSCAF